MRNCPSGITELLNDVHRMTGFADKFTDLRSGRPHKNPNAVLAAVLADASNLGIEKMADASQGISYAQLAWTRSWYLSDENYRAALATLINGHHALPLAAARPSSGVMLMITTVTFPQPLDHRIGA
jgi:hypothetical protein